MAKSIKDVLFKTKNYSKIIKEYNKLSPHNKVVLLNTKEARERIIKIATPAFLIKVLISLPYEIRVNFLNDIDKSKLSSDIDNAVLELLSEEDYNNFDIGKVSQLEQINDKDLLSIIFKYFNAQLLKSIITGEFSPNTKDTAFIEYSKKVDNLYLDKEMIECISEHILLARVKEKNEKKKDVIISYEDFISLNPNLQNKLVLNGNIKGINDSLKDKFEEKYKNASEEELVSGFYNLFEKITYLNVIEMQTILNKCNDETTKTLINEFIKNILKIEIPLEEVYVNSIIYIFKQQDKANDIFALTKLKPFAIINYLKTGIIDKDVDKRLDNAITLDQYQKINKKRINTIKRLLTRISYRTASIPSDTAITVLSYKIYLVLGYTNTLELLNDKFGHVDYNTLHTMFYQTKVKDVNLIENNNSWEPVENQDFINFIIGDKKDNNTTLRKILRGEVAIIKKEFSFIYNNLNKIQNAIGKKLHLNTLLPLLTNQKFILAPDEYKLTKDIIDTIIKSYSREDILTGQLKLSAQEERTCIEKACDIYHTHLEKRVVSSIPRVKGTIDNGYSYEVLKLDDPTILTLGYKTQCCFRINGQSETFLKYCSGNEHGRVIVIKSPAGEIVGMTPVIRNGNYLAGNSLEAKKSRDQVRIYNTLKKAYEDIILYSSSVEENPILACTTTDLHFNVLSKESAKNIYPISDTTFYNNYGCDNYLVAIKEGINKDDLKEFIPTPIYYDERPEVLLYHYYMSDITQKEEAEKRIKSILYKANLPEYYTGFARYIVVSEDWLIKVSDFGVDGVCLDKDPRAKEEFETIKKYLTEKTSGKSIYEIDINGPEFNIDKLNTMTNKKLELSSKENKEMN